MCRGRVAAASRTDAENRQEGGNMKRKRRWAIPVALVVAVLVAAGCGSKQESMSAGADWTTNGGATSNQRYSSLDEIDTSNVSRLKGVWRTHLNGVAMAAKYSG